MKFITKTGGLADPSTLQGGFLFAVIYTFSLSQPWCGHSPALCKMFPATARKLPGNCPDNSPGVARMTATSKLISNQPTWGDFCELPERVKDTPLGYG